MSNEYSKSKAPAMKKGTPPKTIKEAQPKPIPQRYAMATGVTPACGTAKTKYKG
jgi:hypothetical protein